MAAATAGRATLGTEIEFMQAVRPDEADVKLVERKGGIGRRCNYIGVVGDIDLGPQGFLVERPFPRAVIDPHFHDVDQFQIVVRGDGRIGKKKVAPITFQYADAFTPYGPIVANEDGISFFTLRPVASGGHWGMPGNKHVMPCRAGRNIDGGFVFGDRTLAHGDVEREPLMAAQDDGVAAMGLRLGPDTSTEGFASDGGGQYYVVCGGSVIQDGKELPPMSLLYVAPGEAAPILTAGADGAALLMAQFSRPTERPGSNPAELAKRQGYEDHRNR